MTATSGAPMPSIPESEPSKLREVVVVDDDDVEEEVRGG